MRLEECGNNAVLLGSREESRNNVATCLGAVCCEGERERHGRARQRAVGGSSESGGERLTLTGTGNLNGNRYANRPVNRNWTNTVNINNVNVRPGWARPGWGVARPWNTGWYGGWGSPPWGWWGARAAVWGIGSLATAAAINNAVNASIAAQTTYIVVPESDFQLLYGSVQPSGNSTINFAVSANGSTYQLTADCNAGLLNGVDPASAAEAQLLNAACQVAFGNA